MSRNSNIPKWARTRPSEPPTPQAEINPAEVDPDEAAVLQVMQTTRACSRERDMALLELSYEQLKLYMEAMYIPGEVEIYRESIRHYRQYISSSPDIYEADGMPRWRRHLNNEAE